MICSLWGIEASRHDALHFADYDMMQMFMLTENQHTGYYLVSPFRLVRLRTQILHEIGEPKSIAPLQEMKTSFCQSLVFEQYCGQNNKVDTATFQHRTAAKR